MTHLSSQELVDLAEGSLSADRAAHLEACDRCRDEAKDLRAVMSDVREVEVPKPSPLFWEHLSRRVSDAVASSDTPTRRVAVGWRNWHSGHLRTVVTSATVVLAVVVGFSLLRDAGNGPGGGVVTDGSTSGGVTDETTAALSTTDVGTTQVDAESDWALVLTMVEAIEWEDGDPDAPFVDRQTIDGALLQLSADERRELVRLLEAELSGSAI